MAKVLVVIDMQNDFVTGSLANPEAEKIVPLIAQRIKEYDGDVFVTKDTHDSSYLSTAEGKLLPVVHCIEGSRGWELVKDIYLAIKGRENRRFLNKKTFGLVKFSWGEYDEYELVGTCTDICVLINALIIKSKHPEANVKVVSSMCAGTTPEKHKEALDILRGCHIEVI